MVQSILNFISNLHNYGDVKGYLKTDKDVANTLSLRLGTQLADRMKGPFPQADKVLYDYYKPDEKNKGRRITEPCSRVLCAESFCFGPQRAQASKSGPGSRQKSART